MWRIELLGGVRAVRDGIVVDRWLTRKTAALLAYLALHPGRHSREVLAEMLWPDAPPETQRHNLRLTLSHLRKALAPDAPVDADRFGVHLCAVACDVAALWDAAQRRDRDAVLAAPPLMPGHYDDWVLAEQARLETLRDAAAAWPDTRTWQRSPQPLTRFIGRDALRARLADACRSHRLVTLTGIGGAGKTRLALGEAETWRNAAWVPLVDARSESDSLDRLRTALRLPAPPPGDDPLHALSERLRDVGPALLILDNAERLAEGGALGRIVARLLRDAPPLHILVTSRRSLDVHGEALVPVPPLTPDESAALFVDRARLVDPTFCASQESIDALCALTEGIPLALEVAAARMRTHGPAELIARLRDRRHRLESPQGSMDAALQASLDLLPARTRTALLHLAPFRGGFLREAAEQVADADSDTLDALVRWSLAHAEPIPDGTRRFALLETVRDFARERLTPENTRTLDRRHAAWTLAWLEANRIDDARPDGPRFAERLARLSREQDNVRAALDASATLGDVEVGLRLVTAFWGFWFARNAGPEMERWARRFLDAAGPDTDPLWIARAHAPLALALREQGDVAGFRDAARTMHDGLAEGPRDRHFAHALHLRGLADNDAGALDEAERWYAQAEALWLALGDPRNAATTRHNRAFVAHDAGRDDDAEALALAAREVLEAFDEFGWAGSANRLLGGIAARRGDRESARAYLGATRIAYRRIGYLRGEGQVERDLAQVSDDDTTELAHESAALAAFLQVGDRLGEAQARLAVAALLQRRAAPGDAAQARRHRDAARSLYAQFGWPAVGAALADAP